MNECFTSLEMNFKISVESSSEVTDYNVPVSNKFTPIDHRSNQC